MLVFFFTMLQLFYCKSKRVNVQQYMWAGILCAFLCYQDLLTSAIHAIANGIMIEGIAVNGIQPLLRDIDRKRSREKSGEAAKSEENEPENSDDITLIILA